MRNLPTQYVRLLHPLASAKGAVDTRQLPNGELEVQFVITGDVLTEELEPVLGVPRTAPCEIRLIYNVRSELDINDAQIFVDQARRLPVMIREARKALPAVEDR